MSSSARIALVVAAVAVLVAAFVALSPGGDDEPTTAGTGSGATTSPGTSSSTTGTSTTPPARTTTTPPVPPPTPAYATIRVRAGAPVGDVRTVRVEKGDTARIRVTSTDTSDEIHLHGYDLYRDVAPGSPARFAFRATAEGIFEIELHGSGAQIGRLVVEP